MNEWLKLGWWGGLETQYKLLAQTAAAEGVPPPPVYLVNPWLAQIPRTVGLVEELPGNWKAINNVAW